VGRTLQLGFDVWSGRVSFGGGVWVGQVGEAGNGNHSVGACQPAPIRLQLVGMMLVHLQSPLVQHSSHPAAAA